MSMNIFSSCLTAIQIYNFVFKRRVRKSNLSNCLVSKFTNYGFDNDEFSKGSIILRKNNFQFRTFVSVIEMPHLVIRLS